MCNVPTPPYQPPAHTRLPILTSQAIHASLRSGQSLGHLAAVCLPLLHGRPTLRKHLRRGLGLREPVSSFKARLVLAPVTLDLLKETTEEMRRTATQAQHDKRMHDTTGHERAHLLILGVNQRGGSRPPLQLLKALAAHLVNLVTYKAMLVRSSMWHGQGLVSYQRMST